MSPAADGSSANRLLAGLPEAERQRLLARAEPVTLPFGEVVAEPFQPLHHVFFPTGGFLSLITTIEGEPSLEVGLVGTEGMLGANLVLGVARSPTQAIAQGEGPALRLEAEAFQRELARAPALEGVVKRYLYVLIGQLAQTAACGYFHRVEARLARWLLMTRDRAHSDTFSITHEFLAYMLGVRRAGITEAASALQRRRLIRYHRGSLTVLDRRGLMAAACECYAADQALYTQTMG